MTGWKTDSKDEEEGRETSSRMDGGEETKVMRGRKNRWRGWMG